MKRWLHNFVRALWTVTLLYLVIAQLAYLSHFQFLNLYSYITPTPLEQSPTPSGEELLLLSLAHVVHQKGSLHQTHMINASHLRTIIQQQQHQHLPVPHYNHTFPRWGPEGIDLEALLEFTHASLDPNSIATAVPSYLQRSSDYFPETPYIVDENGVWVSKVIRKRTSKHQIPYRVVPSEIALVRARRYLIQYSNQYIQSHTTMTTDNNTLNQSNNNDNNHRWPNLHRVLVTSGGGFPIIVWHGDNKYCNRHNFRRKRKNNNDLFSSTSTTNTSTAEEEVSVSSIPLFTTCAPVTCTHAFPFPTYKTIADSKTNSTEWKDILVQNAHRYPWKTKIRKLVWRGSLSGPIMNYTSARSRIGIFAGRHGNHSLLDIGLSKLPDRHYNHKTNASNVNITFFAPPGGGGRVLLPSMRQQDFAKYVAILDTDGNSWSSRFGGLLCYNSLIVKVEPHYVDYFYKHLQPWKHYVPVRYDLSDLLEKVEWIMHPDNEDAVRDIIRAANQWCQVHMTHEAISVDILDILNDYVGYLDLHSPSWMELWKSTKASFFGPGGGDAASFGMKKLSIPELINSIPKKTTRMGKNPRYHYDY